MRTIAFLNSNTWPAGRNQVAEARGRTSCIMSNLFDSLICSPTALLSSRGAAPHYIGSRFRDAHEQISQIQADYRGMARFEVGLLFHSVIHS
jgi:hypothetical protein